MTVGIGVGATGVEAGADGAGLVEPESEMGCAPTFNEGMLGAGALLAPTGGVDDGDTGITGFGGVMGDVAAVDGGAVGGVSGLAGIAGGVGALGIGGVTGGVGNEEAVAEVGIGGRGAGVGALTVGEGDVNGFIGDGAEVDVGGGVG